MPYARVKNELPIIPGYASGDIVTISDAFPGAPVNTLTANVIGSGCKVISSGKNLLRLPSSPITVQGVTFEETENGITITGSPSSYTFITIFEGVLPVGNYTISDFVTGSNTTHQLVVRKNDASVAYITEAPYTFSVTSTEDIYSIRLYIYSANTDSLIKPQLEIGSPASSYEAGKSVTHTITFTSSVSSGSITINSDGSVDLTSEGTTTRLADTAKVTTLSGLNHIWVDTGAIENLVYIRRNDS